jgi:hypothetical protein
MVALMIGLAPIFLVGTVGAAGSITPNASGGLDCNGQSTLQHPVKAGAVCTDIRGLSGIDNRNTWGGRFYDNGLYIGHDEPDMTFTSKKAGSGDDVSWTETLGTDPAALPTVASPGSDVAHWFELSVAPWFSMAICDSNSYPQLACTPRTDANAPACGNPVKCPHAYPGAGSALLELQFYPPGFSPFLDSTSCDNAHWCAALTIDSLECTNLYSQCNNNCGEPVNFAWIQTDGVPTGPPSPQLQDLNSYTPTANTLLMNPGDKITTHVFDAPAPGGGNALETVVHDVTTGQTGTMQASAANGFADTSIVNCSGAPYNFEPEYSTALRKNIVPWTALQANISTEYEIGHFEPCTSLSGAGQLNYGSFTDTFYKVCNGPYENAAPGGDGSGVPETSDSYCYPQGDTHGVQTAAPDEMSGCLANFPQNGDLDFDGSSYWPEWPTGAQATPSLPGSFVQSPPSSRGRQYRQFFFQTDVALSESTCNPLSSPGGCSALPPGAPGQFYPYWSLINNKGACTIEFGNVSTGANVNDYHGFDQYGKNQFKSIGYSEIESSVHANACKKSGV